MAAFGDYFKVERVGVETGGAQDAHEDGRTEHINIMFDSESRSMAWKDFVEKLKGLEGEWEREGMNLL